MAKRILRTTSQADTETVFDQSGREDQAHTILLMVIQGERGDMVLFDMLSRFARRPRPAPRDEVNLDFGLFARIRRHCAERERVHWASLLVGATVRGDGVGLFLIEHMLKRRLVDSK